MKYLSDFSRISAGYTWLLARYHWTVIGVKKNKNVKQVTLRLKIYIDYELNLRYHQNKNVDKVTHFTLFGVHH